MSKICHKAGSYTHYWSGERRRLHLSWQQVERGGLHLGAHFETMTDLLRREGENFTLLLDFSRCSTPHKNWLGDGVAELIMYLNVYGARTCALVLPEALRQAIGSLSRRLAGFNGIWMCLQSMDEAESWLGSLTSGTAQQA